MMANDKPNQLNHLLVDFERLRSFSNELKDMALEMAQLQKEFGLKKRGFFTSDEHDKIERLLFRYLLCRESLWDFVNYYTNYKKLFVGEENQTTGFLLGFSAAQHLAHYSSKLVATFIDEPKVIAKLNEAYYRSDIPKGTYDRLFKHVTSVKNLKALRTASHIFSEEVENSTSTLSRLAVSDSNYRLLVSHTRQLMVETDMQILEVLQKRSVLLPEVRNQIRHTEIVSTIKRLREGVSDNLYILRGVVFTNIGRFKSPVSSIINFTESQIEETTSMLQPGDIILTYKDGYMSNIFLPGVFKHGIIYVGSRTERQSIGLTDDIAKQVLPSKKDKLLGDLAIETLDSGYQADLIEAVAEGVVFNSLECLMTEPITRLVVLRPLLSGRDRVESLLRTFMLIGCPYDFKFDFNDATYQCCTEVIYRAFNNVGPVHFSLTKRMGLPTLSADDIIRYYLSANPKPFEFILLADDGGSSSSNQAVVCPGVIGETRLKSLLAEK